jgi:hypothetical protein
MERSVVAELMGAAYNAAVPELMGAAYNAAVQQLGSCCWPTASFERGDTQGETRGRGASCYSAALELLSSSFCWRESPRAVPGRSSRMCS